MSTRQKFANLEDYIASVWKTQAALAKKLGVSQNTVSQWVNRKLRVSDEYQGILSNLKPPYDGPFPDPGTNEVTRDDLEQVEKRIEGLIHWAVKELRGEIAEARTDLQASGIAQVAIQSALEELLGKKKG